MFKKYPLYKWIAFSSDLMTIFMVSIIVTIIWTRFDVSRNYAFTSPNIFKFVFLLLISSGYIYIFHLNYLYKLNVITTRSKQLVLLTKSILHSIPVFVILLFFLKERLFEQIRFILLFYFPILFIFFILERVVFIRILYKKLLKKGYLKKNVLVIGAGEAAKMLAAQLEIDTELGLRIVGFVDDDPKKQEFKIFDKPVLGKISDISKELLDKYSVKRFFLAINFISYERLISIIKYCRRFGLPVSLVAKHFNIVDDKLNVSYFDGVSFATFNYFGAANVFYAVFKRTFDILASSILLILLSPFFLIFAILIKLSSEGSVFYKPVMVGRGGRRFVMYKFRSMYSNSDPCVHKELLEDIIVNGEKKGEKIKNDPRITSIGRFLRRHSLDELPQLFNVFLGQMSLVGPRPCIPYELAFYKKWHKLRLSVEPGITGLWQVYGRSNVSFNDMVILDIYYIRNRSIWLDYSILLKTISVVILGSGGS